MSFRPRTILRLRSRTPAMSISKPSHVMPNSLPRRTYDATFALWMMFLLGRHAILGQAPPIYLRSTTATCFPSPAKVHAAIVEPVPPPRITRSNSSGCDFLRTWADEVLSVRFMRLFLSERTIGGPVLGCKLIFELPYPPPPRFCKISGISKLPTLTSQNLH